MRTPMMVGWLVFLSVGRLPLAIAQPEPYQIHENILYRTGDDLTEYMQSQCRLDLYHPTEGEGFATVVWFHGGGLEGGERHLPEELRDQGIAVVPVSYRLAPQVSSPAYLEDAAAAVAWVVQHITEYGGDPQKIFLSGHSAGGYLVSMIGLDKQWLSAFGVDADSIAGLIPFSGHAITHFQIRQEQGLKDTQPLVDEFAPLYHVRASAPPYIMVTGDRELEMLGRYEENAYMMRMMRVVGHPQTYLYEIDGHDHGAMPGPAHHILLHHVRKISQTL